MNMDSFDMILTIAALVMGVMLLTGHGDILMKGGNAAERKKLYDDKKVQLVSGVTLLIFGILTGLGEWHSPDLLRTDSNRCPCLRTVRKRNSARSWMQRWMPSA